MYLVFDVETTGLPKRYGQPMEDVNNWPRITQLAFVLYDKDGTILYEECNLIKPDGWVIPKEQFFIDNNMSTERCEKEGIPIEKALTSLMHHEQFCSVIVAHNINFDRPIVGAELLRIECDGLAAYWKQKYGICTMLSTIKFVGAKHKNGRGGKWPKLEELHYKLFDCNFDNAHDALADVRVTGKCFFELLKRGVV